MKIEWDFNIHDEINGPGSGYDMTGWDDDSNVVFEGTVYGSLSDGLIMANALSDLYELGEEAVSKAKDKVMQEFKIT